MAFLGFWCLQNSKKSSNASIFRARERRELYDKQRKAGTLPSHQTSTSFASRSSEKGSTAPDLKENRRNSNAVTTPGAGHRQQKTPVAVVEKVIEKVVEKVIEVQVEDPALRIERDNLVHRLESTKMELQDAREMQEALRREQAELTQIRNGLDSALIQERQQVEQLNNKIQEIDAERAVQHERADALEQALLEAQEEAGRLEDELSDERAARARAEEAQMALQQRVRELEGEVREGEMMRRALHQEMQELRGNIRVLCRVRPLLPSDGAAEALDMTFARGGQTLEFAAANPRASAVGGAPRDPESQLFKFDKVFAPATTQAQVFEEIQHLVQSALDGYSACIFSYGPTGTGKTYTMEGPENASPEDAGMISRSVDLIFAHTRKLVQQGWHYDMSATFVEIYNEQLRDLLTLDGGAAEKLSIVHNRDGTTDIVGAAVVPVETPADLHRLLKMAAKARSVGSTQSNERSSRSHSVFSLQLIGQNSVTGANASGVLHLVDLAGSERLSKSQATGERLKETQAINKSLSCLGDVIAALAAGDAAHVPYRNSKLTYLLQNSLGGAASKTLMFVQVSPSSLDLSETVSSLRFATKVNNSEIGVARKSGKGKKKSARK